MERQMTLGFANSLEYFWPQKIVSHRRYYRHSLTRMKWVFAIAGLLVVLCGCAIPSAIPSKVTLRGPNLSSESLNFLNIKDTTRNEVISTLGIPTWESTNSLVLLYVSTTATHWSGVIFEPVFYEDNSDVGIKAERVHGNDNQQLKALFIAYDERGFVKSHAVKDIAIYHHRDFEVLCEQYAQGIAKR